MSDFNSAFLTIQQRINITKAAVPSNNAAAYEALVRADKVTELLQPFLGRDTPGFTEYTPACFQQVFATTYAVNQGATLVEARGAGRLATAVDNIRSIGCGFRRNVRSIERFLGIDPAKLVNVKEKAFNATMPEVTDFYQSAYYYDLMNKALSERENMARSGKKLSAEERQLYLLNGAWTAQKILEYTTEYIARAITHRMPSQQRDGLISGDTSFQEALGECEIAKRLTAAV